MGVAHVPDIAVRVRVQGTVQGVGFRPFVVELARQHDLRGHVRNDSLGVLCLLVGAESRVRRFVDDIRPRAPRLAVVEHVTVLPADPPDPAPTGFTIAGSRSLATRRAHLPVDTHACDDCMREMRDPADRRYGYPFINCTNCGPRYSIVRDLPYDRPATSMAAFPMCPACRAEYEDPKNRRYHAQPIACHDCGPRLTGVDITTGGTVEGPAALTEAARRLHNGEVVAVKSVGGFHLAVDAGSNAAVAGLRRLKNRDWKPFAVMVRDLAAAGRIAVLTRPERAILESPQRPILLARKAAGSPLSDKVAPRNPSVGVMLPSAPHHELLFDHLEMDFVVMTSGNISGDPIEVDNADARTRLAALASYVLEHDRDIVNRLDDSVVRLTDPGDDQPFFAFLRRGRGYAPYYLDCPNHPAGTAVLGAGSELKATAALADGATIYASQHVGDMTNEATSHAHRAATDRLVRLYGIDSPDVVADLHPAFLERTRHLYGAAVGVQHHHAHMASCMLDHGLPDGAYVGVILDGVGYGGPAGMWGAEFFVGGYSDVRRVSSMRTIPLIGGDAAVRHPVRVALAMARESGALDAMPGERIREFLGLTDVELRTFERMLQRGVNTIRVSSMGRFFDGIAALAGFARRSEYEAQGPIEWEGLLQRRHDPAEPYKALVPTGREDGVERLDWRPLVADVVTDLLAGTSPAEVSRRFHTTVATSVATEAARLATEHGVTDVVLSGGVFLNEFLTVHVSRLVTEAGLTARRHLRVPTNDGGIAVGQVAIHHVRMTQGVMS